MRSVRASTSLAHDAVQPHLCGRGIPPVRDRGVHVDDAFVDGLEREGLLDPGAGRVHAREPIARRGDPRSGAITRLPVVEPIAAQRTHVVGAAPRSRRLATVDVAAIDDAHVRHDLAVVDDVDVAGVVGKDRSVQSANACEAR